MKDQDIEAAYTFLDTMVVHLAHDPTYGPVYLQEKLIEARTKQEELADCIIKVNKAVGSVLQDRIAQEALTRIATGPSQAGERQKLAVLRSHHERLKFLLEAAHVRRKNLLRVSQDVRLLLECLRIGMQAPGYRPTPIPESETIRTATQPDVDQATAGAVRDFYKGPVMSGSVPIPYSGPDPSDDEIRDLLEPEGP